MTSVFDNNNSEASSSNKFGIDVLEEKDCCREIIYGDVNDFNDLIKMKKK